MAETAAPAPAPAPAAAAPSPAPAVAAPAPAAAAPAAAPAAAAPAPAPAAAPAAAPAPAAGTVLDVATGAAAADPWTTVPEKYQVKKEDGTLDQPASLAKLQAAHAALEQKLGSGEGRPYRAVDYKVNVPAEFADVITADDPGIAAFKKAAHEAGYSQKQFDLAVSKYLEMAPALVGGAAALDQAAATSKLEPIWGTGDTFKANATHAWRAVQQIGGADLKDALQRELGNNPTFLQFAARVGAQLGEDTTPGTTAPAAGADIIALQSSKAYRDANDPQHAAVSAQVRAWYARQPGASDPIA